MSTMEIFTKGGPCQPVIKHHLSIFYIYFLFNIQSIRQRLKTRKKNSCRFTKQFYSNCSLRTLEMAILAEHAA